MTDLHFISYACQCKPMVSKCYVGERRLNDANSSSKWCFIRVGEVRCHSGVSSAVCPVSICSIIPKVLPLINWFWFEEPPQGQFCLALIQVHPSIKKKKSPDRDISTSSPSPFQTDVSPGAWFRAPLGSNRHPPRTNWIETCEGVVSLGFAGA